MGGAREDRRLKRLSPNIQSKIRQPADEVDTKVNFIGKTVYNFKCAINVLRSMRATAFLFNRKILFMLPRKVLLIKYL